MLKPRLLLRRLAVVAGVIGLILLLDIDFDVVSAVRSNPSESRASGPLRSLDASGPWVVAHRGGYFGGVEGSFDRLRQSIAADAADVLELDVRSSRDGVLLIFHDGRLGRLTACRGPLEKRSYAQLVRDCPLDHGVGPITRLADVLQAAGGRKRLDLEFKQADTVLPGMQMVKDAGAMEAVIFQTGDDRARYGLMRRAFPQARIRFKVGSDAELDWALAQNDPYMAVIEMPRDLVTQARVDRAKAAGKRVSVNTWRWQMSEERFVSACFRAWARGIDYAVTNNPGSCKAQIGQPRSFPALREGLYAHFTQPVLLDGGGKLRRAFKQARRQIRRWMRSTFGPREITPKPASTLVKAG